MEKAIPRMTAARLKALEASVDLAPPTAVSDGTFLRIVPAQSDPTTSPNALDVVFCIDVSGSMNSPCAGDDPELKEILRISLAVSAVQTVVATLDETSTMTAVLFNDNASVVFERAPATPVNKETFGDIMQNIRPEGLTHMGKGAQVMLQQASKIPNAQADGRYTALFLFTDGAHNGPGDPLSVVQTMAAENAESKGWLLNCFAFGYDRAMDPAVLRDMANTMNGCFHFISSPDMLVTSIEHAVASVRATYAVNCNLWDAAGMRKPVGSLLYDHTLVVPEYTEPQVCVTGWVRGRRFELPVVVDSIPVADHTRFSALESIATLLSRGCQPVRESWAAAIPPGPRDHHFLVDRMCSEIAMACTVDTRLTWGYKFMAALVEEITHCRQTNHKSVFGFAADEMTMFNNVRLGFSKAFADLPPMETATQRDMRFSNHITTRAGAAAVLGDAYAQNASKIVHSTATFNNPDSICFRGDSIVLMAEGDFDTTKRADELCVGDEVAVFTANDEVTGATITMGICTEKPRALFTVLDADASPLYITPNHPIKMKNLDTNRMEYVHPGKIDGVVTEEAECGEMYSFAVDVGGACLIVNEVPVITLAHGITGDAVAEHDYYGTDAVFRDFPKGKIHVV
jgi:hypothetical protein